MKSTVSIKLNHEFRRMYSKGKSAAGAHLVLYTRRGPNRAGNRLGITVGAKVGKAVVRNKVRRRLREIFRLNRQKLIPGYDVVVVARVKSRYAGYWDLEKEFLYLADKLGLIVKNEKVSDFSD